MSAEGETAKVYEQVFPPPQQVNGVRQEQVNCWQPPKKVPPGTPLSVEEEALCEELNLENRFFLKGKSQAKRRQRVKEIMARWKLVFTEKTTKVGVNRLCGPLQHRIGTRYQTGEAENQTPHPSTGRNLEKTTGRLDSRWHHRPPCQCMGLTLGPGMKKDGTVRWAIDFRALNLHAVPDSFPTPNIADVLQTFAGSKCFSTLDASKAYMNNEHPGKRKLSKHDSLRVLFWSL